MRFFARRAAAFLSPPFHPHSVVSVYRSVQVGCLDSAGAATCYCDLSLNLAEGVLGQANDAVTGTRLMTLTSVHLD
jgi:hypothetical protein